MEIRKCYEILEVEQDASPEQVRRAYRDIASVWHPDRFSANSRLKQKAEAKLKEINEAYEILENRFSSRAERSQRDEERSREEAHHAEARDMTEAVFEVGTELGLTVFNRLYGSLRRFVSEKQSSRRSGTASYPRDQQGGGMKGPERRREGRGRGGRGRGKTAGRGGRRR